MRNKNLKLKLGLCGLALTSFLALNARTTVHADTVQNSNADNMRRAICVNQMYKPVQLIV